jgi:hypothetical protein
MMRILIALGALIALYIVYTVYLAMVLQWEDQKTVGTNYYGLSPRERESFKATLRLHARLLQPLLWLNSKLAKLDFRKSRIQYQGISAPTGSCSVDSFKHAAEYQPRPEDVFVVTQMKCGTTWMQQIVYEVLNRGSGDLVDSGKTMYALSPWLEGRKSVSIEDAPLVGGERPSRIIKTHLPAQLCPFSDGARYIYVARHPVSCFASCIDFVQTNVGAMAPRLPAYEEWYCTSDLMWWGTWTDHVRGWWARSQSPNVLFVYFEEMKRDLTGVIRRVADFLRVPPLSDAELAEIERKAGFSYMQQHQTSFEMHPPHILQTNAALFVSGKADRHRDVPADVRDRILDWSARGLAESGFPLGAIYPDTISRQKVAT